MLMRNWTYTALGNVPVNISELQGNRYLVSIMYPNEPKSWEVSSFELIRGASFATIMTTPFPNMGTQIEILLADSELRRLFPVNDRVIAIDIS